MSSPKTLILTAMLVLGIPALLSAEEYCHTICYTDYTNLHEGFFWEGEVLFYWGDGTVEKLKGFLGLPELVRFMAGKGFAIKEMNTGNEGKFTDFSISIVWIKN